MAVSFIGGGNRSSQPNLPKVKYRWQYHIKLPQVQVGMELTTLLVVVTDKIGRCKSNYMYVQGYKLTVIQSHKMTKIELGDLEVGNYLVILFRVEDIFLSIQESTKLKTMNNWYFHKNKHENMPHNKLLGNQHIIAYV